MKRMFAAASTRALVAAFQQDRNKVVASVVLYTHYHASCLNLTLAALERQNLPSQSWEVIVVYDASLDDTPAVLREYSQRDKMPLIAQRMEETIGAVRARNAAIAAARGTVLVFLGDGQLVYPDFLMRHLLHHARAAEPCVVLGNSHRRVHTHLFAPTDPPPPGVALPPLFTPEELLARLDDAQQLPTLLLDDAPDLNTSFASRDGAVPHPLCWTGFNLDNASLPRARVLAAGGFDESFRDWGLAEEDLAYRLHQSGMAFRYEPNAVSLGQLHPGQTVSGVDVGCNLHRFFCKHSELDRSQIEPMLLNKRFA